MEKCQLVQRKGAKRLINEFHLREVFSGEEKMGKGEIWLWFYRKRGSSPLASFLRQKLHLREETKSEM